MSADYPTAPKGSAIQNLFDRLAEAGCTYDGAEDDGGNYLCPCHDDHTPSLHVEGGDSQAVVVICRSHGTSLPGILAALAARKALVVGGKQLIAATSRLAGRRVEPDEVDWGSKSAQKSSRRGKQGELGKYVDTVVYDYLTPSGEPVRRVTRTNFTHGKAIGQLRPWTSPTGFQTWIGGVKNVPVTPYDWERFAGWLAKGRRGLYVCEGEKSADALSEAGKAATTYPGGSGAPLPSASEVQKQFEGFEKFKVWADADVPGLKRAFKVSDLLTEAFPDASVRVVMNAAPLQVGDDAADLPDLSDLKESIMTIKTAEQGVALLADALVTDVTDEPAEDNEHHRTDKEVAEQSAKTDATLAETAYDVLDKAGRTLLPVAGVGWISLNKHTGTWRLFKSDDGARREILKALERVGKRAITKGDKAKVDIIMKARNIGKLRQVVEMYRTMYGDRVTAMTLDAAPYVRAFSNGLVDVRTGTLVPPEAARGLYITKSTGLNFEPDARSDLLDKVLEAQDKDVMDYLLDALALAFAGEDRGDPVSYFVHGPGSNAKTTILGCAVCAMGSYAGMVSHKIITAKPSDHSTERTDLRGLAVAWIEELPQGPLNGNALKQVDRGAGAVVARRMRQDDMTFAPTAHIFVTGNYLPTVHDNSGGMWRRLEPIHMEKSFLGKADANIKKAMLHDPEVQTAMLAELVRRCVRLAGEGWKWVQPDFIKEGQMDWRQKADPVLRYFRERIEEDISSPGIRVTELLDDMEDWSRDLDRQRLPTVNEHTVGKVLDQSGLPVRYEVKRARTYLDRDGQEMRLPRETGPVSIWPGVRWKEPVERTEKDGDDYEPY